MKSKILSGKKIAQKIIKRLKVKELKDIYFAVVLVGQSSPTMAYLHEKIKKARELGIKLKLIKFRTNIQEKEVMAKIQALNHDPKIRGILVHLPLPRHLEVDKILSVIEPQKDIDGARWPTFSPFLPPTPQAILALLEEYKINFQNKKIVLIGQGRLVGRPLELMFRQKGVRPIICDSKTKNIQKVTKEADILISATGVKGLVKKDWVKKGAVVVDCAEDVREEVGQVAAYLTPKIGGLGPLTVAFLFKNLIEGPGT